MLLPPITFLRDTSSGTLAHSGAIAHWLDAMRGQQTETLGETSIIESEFLNSWPSAPVLDVATHHLDQARICFDLVSAASVCAERFALVVAELETQVRRIHAQHGNLGLVMCRRLLLKADSLLCLDHESHAFCLGFCGRLAEQAELPAASRMKHGSSRAVALFVHDSELAGDAEMAEILGLLRNLGQNVRSVDLGEAAPQVAEETRAHIELAPLHIHIGAQHRAIPGFRIADSLGQRATVAHMRGSELRSGGTDVDIVDLFNGFLFSSPAELNKIVRSFEADSFLRSLFQRNAGQALLTFNTQREATLLNWLKNSAQKLSTLQ